MPRDSQGGYSLPSGTLVSTGDTILASQHNPAMSDIAQALGNSLDRNGSGGMRAPLNMGGNPVQNAASGSSDSDVATVGQVRASGKFIGEIFDFAGASPPAGSVLCYGQALSRTEYADLFTAIGTVWGVGDGSTTFNVPDLRGRVRAGKDDMGGAAANRLTTPVDGDALGSTGGVESITLTTAQMPTHSHGNTTGSAGAHTHNVNAFLAGSGGFQSGAALQSGNLGAGIETATAGAHTHSIAAEGDGQSHSNVQPTAIVLTCIKARNV